MFKIYQSIVPGFEGACVATWLNHNRINLILDQGQSGFFKRVQMFCGIPLWKTGTEFHGIIRTGKIVETVR